MIFVLSQWAFSLLDCIDSDINVACENVYKKITAKAARLVEVGEQIEKELESRS